MAADSNAPPVTQWLRGNSLIAAVRNQHGPESHILRARISRRSVLLPQQGFPVGNGFVGAITASTFHFLHTGFKRRRYVVVQIAACLPPYARIRKLWPQTLGPLCYRKKCLAHAAAFR